MNVSFRSGVNVVRSEAVHPDFRALVRLLDADLVGRYGEVQLSHDRYNTPDLLEGVVVAYLDGASVGCGAFRVHSTETIEIKRMFVKPEARGAGVAAEIMRELERWGIERGCRKAILETGNKQPEAVRFYEKMGYRRIENYAQYVGDPISICMGKDLKGDTAIVRISEEIFLSPIVEIDKPAHIEHFKEKEIADRLLRVPCPYTEKDADEK